MRKFAHPLVTQYRVIVALMLREIHTIYGNTRLGYLWVIIQSSFGIGVFWAVREFLGSRSPHGMSVPLFLITGFGLWTIISDTVSKSMTAVAGNRALITFAQVTELDVIIGRALVIFFTQVIVSIILIFVAIGVGFDIQVNDFINIILGLFFALTLGVGVGTTLSSFAVFYPVIERLVPIIFRLLFFVSGVFFSVSTFSQDIAEVLLYNPIFHIIELTRVGFSYGYPAEGCSWSYVCEFSLIALFVGLITERYVRQRRVFK